MPESRRIVLIAALAATAFSALSQEKKEDNKPPKTEEEILKSIKLPEGYEATVFAKAP
jgi:hypothetical protein